MKNIMNVAIVLLIVMAIGTVGCTRKSRTAIDRWANDMREIDRVEDVDNRMNSYEYFFDMYEQISAYKLQYETETDPDVKRGIQNIVNREIGKYNADSAKYFKAMWKDRNLPDRIDLIR